MLHHGRHVNPLAIWQVLVAALDTKLTAGGPPIVTLGTVHRPRLLEAVRVCGGGLVVVESGTVKTYGR